MEYLKPAVPQTLRVPLATAATRMADELLSARTTLPWLLAVVGSPLAYAMLLVPLRETLSMLPQARLAVRFSSLSLLRPAWLLAGLLQALCIAVLPLAFLLPGAWAGPFVLLLLALYSTSRAGTSLAGKELLAKTVSKRQRGRSNGLIAALGSPALILAGLSYYLLRGRFDDTLLLAGLAVTALLLWLLALVLVAGLEEPASPDGEAGTPVSPLQLLHEDALLRALVMARGLLLWPILASPLIVTEVAGSQAAAGKLGLFIVLNGLVGLLASPLWGRLADYSARASMCLGGLLATLALLVLALAPARPDWLALCCFVLLMTGYGGIRVGRKTFVVQIDGQQRRLQVIGASNALTSLLLLLAGLLSSLTALLAPQLLYWLLALPALAGSLVALRLRA